MKNFLLSIFTLIHFSVFAQTFQVTTLAGNGTSGNIDATGSAARFASMAGSTVDNDGNIYVCDPINNKIRKITPSGVVTTFAGTGTGGFVNGAGNVAQFNVPNDICFDKVNNIFYVADMYNNCIRSITLSGNVATIAGSNLSAGLVNGIGTNARFNYPSGIDVDIAGNLVVADRNNHAIRKIIVATGQVSTLAGNGISGYTDGFGSSVRFNSPTDVVINANGFTYITDYSNNRIRAIDYAGNSFTIAGSGTPGNSDGTTYLTAEFDGPYALCFMNSCLLVTDRLSHRIRKIDFVKQIVETIAGNSQGSVDGVGASALFNAPSGIVTNGYIAYVSDWNNFSLRKITVTDSCTNATPLTANSGTVSMGVINGNIPIGTFCYGSYSSPNQNANANWWAFTPTQNGLLNISSATPNNATTVNTRLAILTGTCGNFTCYSFNDNISTTDLRSSLTEILLNAGTTYYFVWDDIYTDNAAVDFAYTFTPQTCFRPTTTYIYDAPTDNSVHIGWTAPTIGDTSIDSYTLEIGPSGFTPGTGTALFTATTSDTNHLFTGLSTGVLYTVWIKSTCAPSDISSWRGISTYTQFTATNTNYTENFDSSSNYLNLGWNRNPGVTNSSTWSTVAGTGLTQSGAFGLVSRPEYNTPANTYVYSRKINLVSGQNYRVSYYVKKNATYYDGKYKVLLVSNNTYYLPTNHTVLYDDQNLTSTTFVLKEHDFTVNTNAAYRIGFKNESSKNIYYTLSGGLYIDTFSVSTVLSVEDFEKTSLSLYPNPVLDFISIDNPDNIQINAVSVIDMNGRELLNNKYTNTNNTINLSNLSKGIYFIQLNTEKGILSKKIIKE